MCWPRESTLSIERRGVYEELLLPCAVDVRDAFIGADQPADLLVPQIRRSDGYIIMDWSLYLLYISK